MSWQRENVFAVTNWYNLDDQGQIYTINWIKKFQSQSRCSPPLFVFTARTPTGSKWVRHRSKWHLQIHARQITLLYTHLDELFIFSLCWINMQNGVKCNQATNGKWSHDSEWVTSGWWVTRVDLGHRNIRLVWLFLFHFKFWFLQWIYSVWNFPRHFVKPFD